MAASRPHSARANNRRSRRPSGSDDAGTPAGEGAEGIAHDPVRLYFFIQSWKSLRR